MLLVSFIYVFSILMEDTSFYEYAKFEPTSRHQEGEIGEEEEEEEEKEDMAEMSMKTKAASQEVVVASRREAMGRRGEVEADARGTRSTWKYL